jgi:predicted PurR-regulated permease PerM
MEKYSVSIAPKTLWTILAMVVGVFVAWELRSFLMVVLVSVIIASFIEAGTRALKRAKIPRIVSVVFLYLVGFAVIFGVLYLIVPLFASELSDFIALFPKNSSIVTILAPVANHGLTGATLKNVFENKNLISNPAGVLASIQGIFGGLVNALLVIIISFYLSVQEKGIEQFLRVVTPDKYEDYVVDVWNRTERKIGYWFGGQALVAVLIGLITYVGLFLLGVPYALILAAISFVFEFVPFGTLLSMAPAVVLGFLGGGFGLAVEIFIFYGILHYIDAYFLQPYVLNRTIGMPMLVIILSIIACWELFGVIGVVVAIPIAVLILELIYDRGLRRMPKTSHVHLGKAE